MNQYEAHGATIPYYWHRGNYPDMDEELGCAFLPSGAIFKVYTTKMSSHSMEVFGDEAKVYMLVKDLRDNGNRPLPCADYYEEVGEC